MTVDGASYASLLNYNAASQTTSLNVGGTTNQLSETYSYDSMNGLLAGQTVQRTNVGTILNLSYDYLRPSTITGKTGQLTKITNNLDGTGNKNRTYDYDGIGRLKTAKGGVTGTLWTQTYSHDRLGNRTNVVATGNAAGTGGAMPTDGLPTTANYESASNRLTSIVPNASTGINPANPRTSIMTQQAIRRVSSKATASRNDTVTTQWEGWRRSKPTTTLHRQQRPK